MIITSTTLVQMCAKMAAISSNQAGLSGSDFLNIANSVMTVLTSELLAAREEYLLYEDSIPVAVGQGTIRIPYRSVSGELRHLWWEDGTGNRIKLGAASIEDMESYQTTSLGRPNVFYIMGNSVVLLPTPNLIGSLVVAYPFRPNLLVDASTTQSISVVAGNVLTLPNIPSNFVGGALYDIIDHTSGNGIIAYDQMATIAGNLLTFPNGLSGVSVGNYVAQAGQSPVPMLPEDGHNVLLETVILRIEMMRGAAGRVKNSTAIVQDARKAWDRLLLNRVASKAKPAGMGGEQFPLRPF